MRVLLVGSGAREHAMAWRMLQSPGLTRLWVADGNGGTAQIAENLDVKPEDVQGIEDAAKRLAIDLVAVGPEAPLAAGLVDRLSISGIPAFGPTGAAAQIEASKSFALGLMREAGVPCPEFRAFHEEQAALEFLRNHGGPVVVKADGLAAGKGVALCGGPEDAVIAVRACMTDRVFGEAGSTVVVEEYLTGPEVSVFGFSDGEHISSLVAACDYKRLGDGDEGPNTGGMGSFAPPDFWNEELSSTINQAVMEPVIRKMSERGMPYRGVLYAGIMLTADGPKVLEFNCRLGDPETQVVMPQLLTDPLDLMTACIEGTLDSLNVEWDSRCHVGVVMVSGGYPGPYETGFEIGGLADELPDSLAFHAGTRLVKDGRGSRLVSSGGRVLTVVGSGESLAQARSAAYHRVDGIVFQDARYRTDIAAVEGRAAAWQPGTAPIIG